MIDNRPPRCSSPNTWCNVDRDYSGAADNRAQAACTSSGSFSCPNSHDGFLAIGPPPSPQEVRDVVALFGALHMPHHLAFQNDQLRRIARSAAAGGWPRSGDPSRSGASSGAGVGRPVPPVRRKCHGVQYSEGFGKRKREKESGNSEGSGLKVQCSEFRNHGLVAHQPPTAFRQLFDPGCHGLTGADLLAHEQSVPARQTVLVLLQKRGPFASSDPARAWRRWQGNKGSGTSWHPSGGPAVAEPAPRYKRTIRASDRAGVRPWRCSASTARSAGRWATAARESRGGCVVSPPKAPLA